jgi:hypothetical protein
VDNRDAPAVGLWAVGIATRFLPYDAAYVALARVLQLQGEKRTCAYPNRVHGSHGKKHAGNRNESPGYVLTTIC